MSLNVITVMMSPKTDQYAGKGGATTGISDIVADAKAMEDLGFDGIMAPEAGHDPYLPLVLAAEHTQRVKLGTNVAVAFPRSPMATAQVAWDLQNFSDGRHILGLGTQVKAHNERRYSTPWPCPPVPRLREYVQCMRAIFETFQSGKVCKFEGEHYQFSMINDVFNPGPIAHPEIPIFLAAATPTMAKLCGEISDGVLLHPIDTFAFTKGVILKKVEEGAAKAGRKRADIEIVGSPFLVTGENEEEIEKAKAAARQRVAFYGSTPTYQPVFRFHGWEDIGQQLHAYSRERKWADMPGLISDELLNQFAVIATYDELADKLKALSAGVFDTVLLDLPPKLRQDPERVRSIVKALR